VSLVTNSLIGTVAVTFVAFTAFLVAVELPMCEFMVKSLGYVNYSLHCY
jgi:hypothetical protein